jgi:hypothetical protein
MTIILMQYHSDVFLSIETLSKNQETFHTNLTVTYSLLILMTPVITDGVLEYS